MLMLMTTVKTQTDIPPPVLGLVMVSEAGENVINVSSNVEQTLARL